MTVYHKGHQVDGINQLTKPINNKTNGNNLLSKHNPGSMENWKNNTTFKKGKV